MLLHETFQGEVICCCCGQKAEISSVRITTLAQLLRTRATCSLRRTDVLCCAT